jgi:sugar lactone lactonase YvrE
LAIRSANFVQLPTTLPDMTSLGKGSIVSLGVLFLGLARLDAQTTFMSYDFTTLAVPAGFTGGTSSGFRGIAVDGSGNLYVSNNNTIIKIAPADAVTTLAGTPGVFGSADGTGNAAQFDIPTGVAVDASGNVYVSDMENYTIRKITSAGVVTTLAGTAGVYGSADGTGSAAQFDSPQGIAVDASGNVYVADEGASTIRKITPAGVVTTLAGTAGVCGSADGTGSAAQFYNPQGVAVDASGNVYVADSSYCTIRKITPTGVVTTLAGTASEVGGSSDGTGSAAQFNSPSGMAVDSRGNVYVGDTNNKTIRMVTAGGVVTTLAGLPGYGGATNGIGPAALFAVPQGVAVDGSGNMFVVDYKSIRSGHSVTQIRATIRFDNLDQSYDGTAKTVSVTTSPAGLQTIELYEFQPGLSETTLPTNEGSYTIFAAIVDPTYSGSIQGTLTIGSGLPAHTSLIVRNTQAGGSFLWGITAGPSGLVTVGTSGTILGSGNGFTWIQRDSGTANWLTAVAYGGGQYIAVGDHGCVLLSSDGVRWLSVAQSATTERLDNVIYAAGQYVAVGEGGTIISSPNGRNWTARISGVTGWLRGLTYVNQFNYLYQSGGPFSAYQTGTVPARFLATGQGGIIISSTDGVSWSPVGSSNGSSGSDSGGGLEALVSTGATDFIDYGYISDFVAVGDNGALAIGSWGQMGGTAALGGLLGPREGVDVSSISMPVDFRGLVRCGNALYASGENGTIVTASTVSYYPDLGPWEQLPSGTTANLVGCAAIGDSVYFVGDNETILELTAPYDSRLINLSCRAQVGTGANDLITGFVVGGQGTSGSAPLLIRGSGPALIPFGVSGTLADPELQLFSTASGNSLLATNTSWGGAPAISSEAAAVGAFAWANPSSHDAALLSNLEPGPYTANLFGESGDSGVALTEVYDAKPAGTVGPSSPRLTNISARSQVGSGANILIAGFVIGGSTPKTVLIRASGPALVPFGLTGTLTDPELAVYGSASGDSALATNTGWGANPQIETAAAWVGGFSWGSTATADSAILVTLPPGAYTAQVSGASGDSGLALIEIYEVQ